jgi:hypothetical protein
MIIIDKVLISDEVIEKKFVCNLEACKGACCIEGDEGGIVAKEETLILENIYKEVEDYLSKVGKAAIKKQGKYTINNEGEYRTPLIDGGACAYVVKEKGVTFCGIERAYFDGKTKFRKPVSCHLYPLRTKDLGDYEGLNYEDWEICDPACDFGKTLGLPLYEFVKEAIIRKYGEDFFEALKATAKHVEESKSQ